MSDILDQIDDTLGSCRVSLDLCGLETGDEITDANVPVRDLDPIDRCCLEPGDPVPIGRIPSSGELAYLVYEEHEYVRLTRSESAGLAKLLADAFPEALEGENHPAAGLLRRLITTAAPSTLFEDGASAHATLAHRCALDSARDDVLARGHSPFGRACGWSEHLPKTST